MKSRLNRSSRVKLSKRVNVERSMAFFRPIAIAPFFYDLKLVAQFASDQRLKGVARFLYGVD